MLVLGCLSEHILEKGEEQMSVFGEEDEGRTKPDGILTTSIHHDTCRKRNRRRRGRRRRRGKGMKIDWIKLSKCK